MYLGDSGPTESERGEEQNTRRWETHVRHLGCLTDALPVAIDAMVERMISLAFCSRCSKL